MRISLIFSCNYQVVGANNYVLTSKPEMLVNLKTGRIMSLVKSGGSLGYNINGKFTPLAKIKYELIPKKESLPF